MPSKKSDTLFEKLKNQATPENIAGASSVTLAAAPAMETRRLEKRFVPIDRKSKNLVVLTQGGPHNFGGAGHSSAAKSIAQAHEQKFGKGTATVLNFEDYIKHKQLTGTARKAWETNTQKQPPLKRVWNKLKYIGSQATFRPHKSSKLTKDLKNLNPGRVVVTYPDAVNYLKNTGIRPELVVTDYGVGDKGSKSFWRTAEGVFGKNPKNISNVMAPTKAGLDIFPSVKGKRISSVPVSSEYLQKKNPLKDLPLFDTSKNSTGHFKLPKNKKIVVVSGGSSGVHVDKMVEGLLKSKRKDFHIVAISGKNNKVYSKLKTLESKGLPITAQGWERNYKRLLDSSHVTVLRPHGLSVTEANARGVPNINVVESERLSKTTGKKVYSDNHAHHMVNNAKHYKRQAGSPIATLNKVVGSTSIDSSESLGKSLDNVLGDYKSHKTKARKYQKKIKKDAAKQVVNTLSKTFSKVRTVSTPKKILSYGASAGLGAFALNPYLSLGNSKSGKK